MEQSTDKEREVCKILQNLHFLIKNSKSHFGLPVWGGTGKRADVILPHSTRQQCREEKKARIDDVGVSSPARPFYFPVSESDEKRRKEFGNKVVKKKTKEELLETINELVQTRESLTKDLEKVKSCHNEQKAYNAVLKAKQQELKFRASMPNSDPSKSLNLEMGLGQNMIPILPLLENHQTYHPHFLALTQQHQQNYISHYPSNQSPSLSSPPSSLVSAKANGVGPSGLPDLNASVNDVCMTEFLQPLDHNIHIQAHGDKNRARAAEARKRRMVRLRERKHNLAPLKTSKC